MTEFEVNEIQTISIADHNICDCGGKFSYSNKATHFKTSKHIYFEEHKQVKPLAEKVIRMADKYSPEYIKALKKRYDEKHKDEINKRRSDRRREQKLTIKKSLENKL